MKFQDEIRKKYGTVYTPEFVVEQTVDLAWKYLPEARPLDLTFCDPAAGDGNFLIYVYHKLMGIEDERFPDPIIKSRHILQHCLHGIEILYDMWKSCKIRLLTEHYKIVKLHGGDIKEDSNLYDSMNIHWGNAILIPEDTWNPDNTVGEGGMLPEEVRNNKYDAIVGNPPYTHLRNLKNEL